MDLAPKKASIMHGLKTLIFPEICIMCHQEFESICERCRDVWMNLPITINTPGFKTYSIVAYDKAVSSVVLKAKEDQNRIAQELMAEALVSSISAWRKEVDLTRALLVPIPSTKRAIRRRGQSFLHPILNKVRARFSVNHDLSIEWQELLIHTRSVKDQAGLSSQAREKNLKDSFAIRIKEQEIDRLAQRPIIVIDDVVTTGATLTSAISALRERKMTVLGASTACASAH